MYLPRGQRVSLRAEASGLFRDNFMDGASEMIVGDAATGQVAAFGFRGGTRFITGN